MDVLESAKQRAVGGMGMFLRNFSYVPDEKLHWAPTPTAKSPLRVAAHTALYAGRFAVMIRERKLPMPEDLSAWIAGQQFKNQDVVALAAVGRSLGRLEGVPARPATSRVPTLFIHGEKESRYVLARIAETGRWFPDAQFTVVPGADHMTTLRSPIFGRTLVEFLTANRTGS